MDATDVLTQGEQYHNLTFEERRLLVLWNLATDEGRECAMTILKYFANYKRREEEKTQSVKAEVIDIQGGIKNHGKY